MALDDKIITVQDIEEIYMAMEQAFNDMDGEFSEAFLDTETGDVVYVFVPEDLDETDEEDSENGEYLGSLYDKKDIDQASMVRANEGRGKRYLRIPDGEHWWGHSDLQAFIDQLTNPNLQRRLARAIQGRGAFQRFREIVGESEALEDDWIAFREARHEMRVREWLEGEGFQLVNKRATEK